MSIKSISRVILPAALMAVMTVPAMAAKPSGSVSSLSGAASKKPKISVTHVKSWEVRCAPGSPKRCEMAQTVRRKSDNKPMMRVIVGYARRSQKPVAIFDLPLGMRLPPGVKLSVDGNKAVTFPVQLCVSQGCRAALPLKPALLKELQAGHDAKVTIRDPRGRPLALDVSLMGFTDALKQISP